MYATTYLPMNAQQPAKENRVGPVLVTIGAHVALIAVLAVGLKVVVTKDPFEASKLVEIPITQQIEILDPVAPIPRGQEFFIKPDMPVIPTAPTDTGTGITITPPPIPDGFVDGRAGAGPVVQEPMVNASIVRSFEPPYPSVSRLKDEQGTVIVRIMITPFGTAGDVQLEKSSGYSRLDEAAIKAVRTWKFAPAKRGSQAISTWVSVPVKFVLNSNR